MSPFICRPTVLFFALAFCTAPYAAEEQVIADDAGAEMTAAHSTGSIDPFVDAMIRQASDYLAMAKSYSLHVETTVEEVSPSGRKIQLSRSADVLVRRPDRLRAEVVSDGGVTRFYYDGKHFSRFDLDKNTFARIDVPSNLEAALDHAMERFQLDAPLADFLAGNLYDNFILNTDSGYYAGVHYMDGANYHHLALSNENVDFQIWISDDMAPLIRKIVITYKHVEAMPQFTAILSDWEFNPRAPDMVFNFYPPIDADEIEYLPVTSIDSGVKK